MEETAHLNDGTHEALDDPVPKYILEGYSAVNRLTFTVDDFNRQTAISMRTFAIM